ncbi:MAG: RNA polymerase sigma factor [Armatimonadetes bacterium]|nr:RNA polymerase sigma factor [Armatimonadota bacterium]
MGVHAAELSGVLTPEPDEELARRSQCGDVSAYAELVRRHRWAMHSIARGILGSVDEAEDVTQEALLRGYRGIRGFDSRHVFAGWLRRIAVNCAISRLREQKRERRRLEALSAEDRWQHTPDPVERVATVEVARSVRAALGYLPPRQGLAFTLFHFEDKSLAETAQALGCSVNAIKVQLHRARRKLARRLVDPLPPA